jgi:RNA polymerase sigma-70 factor, ECF subfamily
MEGAAIDILEPSDAELMAGVREGDREAFGRLVDRHEDGLVNYLTRLAGSRDRAEDLAQEAFLRLFHAAARFDASWSLEPYLYRIATNLLRSEERRDRRRRLLLATWLAGSGGNGHLGQPAAAPERLLREEMQRRLTEALAALPLAYRVPLVLSQIAGWPYEEIARLVGCREGTVKSRIHRGRRRLRAALDSYRNGDGR